MRVMVAARSGRECARGSCWDGDPDLRAVARETEEVRVIAAERFGIAGKAGNSRDGHSAPLAVEEAHTVQKEARSDLSRCRAWRRICEVQQRYYKAQL